MKKHLKKRLNTLWTLELANAILFFPVYYYVISLNYRLGWFSLVSLGVVCAILIVGSAFWFLKRRALDGSDLLVRPAVRRFFRISKGVFGATLLVLLSLFVVRSFGQQDVSLAELVIGGALMLLAFLEYINYYYIQLMYDNWADILYLRQHRRLKRGIMVRELDI